MKRPRILLADDHPMVLEGIAKIVSEFGDVVGKVEDGLAVLDEVRQVRPDMVILDISMPGLNGLDLARHLKTHHPGCRILFLTMHADLQYVNEAFESGATGYLLKRSAVNELQHAMETVMRGHSYISPLIRQEEGPVIGLSPNGSPTYFKTLTPRQREVLKLIAEGHSLKEIAFLLNLSPKTVDFHKCKVMESLGLHNIAHLTKYAVSHGLVGQEPAGNSPSPRLPRHERSCRTDS
jgi:DNA-binding NarL/FixJ family response regulator